jgi:hypothetical protein
MKLNKQPTKRVRKETSEYPEDPKVGDLLVWHHYEQVGMLFNHLYAVTSSDEAMAVIDHLAKSQVNDESVGYNIFGLSVFQTIEGDYSDPSIDPSRIDCEWGEWSNDGDWEIDDLMRERPEKDI